MKLAPVIAALVVVLTTSARADIIPPNVGQCHGKKAGDACELFGGGGMGVCEDKTCSRVLPNGQEDYPCTTCVPRAEPEPATTAPPETAPTPATAPPGKASKCDAGGAEGLLAMGVALVITARRRRRSA